MGLLDFDDQVDDFAFANFDTAVSPAESLPETPAAFKKSTSSNYFPQFTTSGSLESVATTTSSTSSQSKSRSRSSSSRKRTRTFSKTARTKRSGSGSSFDLYGHDEELQEAEPRISFCEICLRPCEIHH